MTLFAALTFSGTQWLWPGIAFLALALGVLVWSYRSGTGAFRWVCLGLKTLGLVALALCLLEPLWFGERAKVGANLIAVVADNSQGMQIKDTGSAKTRGENLVDLVDPAKAVWLAELGDTFELRRYLFDSRLQSTSDYHELVFDGRSSGIAGALRTLKERFQGRALAGVFLLTDGNATDIKNSLPDLTGVPPVYPVVIGKPDAIKDISVQQVSVTQTAFEDAPVTIQADVNAPGYGGQKVTVKLNDRTGKTLQEQTSSARSGAQAMAFRFELKPDTPGLSFYQVVASPADASTASEEATLVNNTRVVVVNRDTGPYRILYVSGRPNWEYKFLHRALEDDKELDLVGFIRVAKREPKFNYLGRAGETVNPLFSGFEKQAAEDAERFDQAVMIRLNTKDEIELKSGFPRTPEDLYEYHAIIVDDLESAFFTPDQSTLVQKFVSERGGGFMMLGGMESFEEGKYARTPIGDMLPVYLDNPIEQAAPTSGWFLNLSREGWLQPWVRLRKNQDEERTRLESSAPYYVMNKVHGIKPGATVLANVNAPGQAEVPAFITQKFGRGMTGAILAGDIWHWGFKNAEAHADMDKWWRQVARRLVSDVPKRVELAVEQQEDDVNGAVKLQVRVRDARYQPLGDATVMVEVAPVTFGKDDPGALAKPIQLRAEAAASELGLFEATYVPRLTGGYKVTAVASNSVGAEIGKAEAGFSSDPAADEFRSLVPNVALLENIAQKTGGQVVAAADLEAFVKKLPNLHAPVMETWSYPLWHTPAMFAFALACLLAEWGIRRFKGMP
ncbi:MAG: hypothetical protein RL324_199 [Verrucomicrobiota bacterium]|jgi:uncharacterized membrane protein